MGTPFRVFISHFALEKKIAEEIQYFLKDAFPTVSVFRSSDAYSIATSEGQYSALIDALFSADLMIVLLSSESSRRPWMPFETGFSMGRKIPTFTLLVRGAKPSDVPSPFAEMQLRQLDQIEAEKILKAVEDHAGVRRESVAINSLLRAVAAAEAGLPNVVLKLEPYMMSSPPACLSFRLIYEGHTHIEIRRFTAGILEADMPAELLTTLPPRSAISMWFSLAVYVRVARIFGSPDETCRFVARLPR